LAEDKSGEADTKEKNQPLIITNRKVPAVVDILSSYAISLTASKNGMGGPRKAEDGKEEKVNKKKVELYTNAVMLNNNEIRDLKGLYDTLNVSVLYNINYLQWINLSYNYLVTLDPEIKQFKNLKSLQLHGNYINDLEEVKKLGELEFLFELTLNGNPIEEIPGYRLYVLALMYQKNENLRKLDTVIVTDQEFDSVLVWKGFKKGTFDRIKTLKINNLKKRPPPKEVEENNASK
jgi:Leucine-rich repeat (LRR) protein